MTIETALEEYLENVVPSDIKQKIAALNANLFYGPSCGTWDRSVIDDVKEYVEQVDTLYYCNYSGYIEKNPDLDDAPEDYCEISSNMIVNAICGKELASTIW